MPGHMPPIDMSRQLADALKRIQRLERATAAPSGGGFDPNADPVVIGSAANGNGTPSGIIVGVNAVAENGSGGGAGYEQITIGPNAYTGSDDAIAIGAGVASTATWAVGIGYYVSADGQSSVAISRNTQAEGQYDIAIGTFATTSFNSPFSGTPGSDNIAIGRAAKAGNDNGGSNCVAIGQGASATLDTSVAIGWQAQATKAKQIMLGSSASFVEIPGDSSSAPNGLVLTDTATGTRYIIRITSGALVLSAAP